MAAEAAKALANVLGIYLQPKRHDTAIKMTGADGTTIEITGASLTGDQLESTTLRIKALREK